MADTMSSDATSEYPDDDLSDISAERQSNHVVVGQKPRSFNRRSEKNFLRKLFTREIRGCLSTHSYAPEDRLFTTIPPWGHLPLLQVIPLSALEAGHIVMGLTQCGQFLLTYTYSMDLRANGSHYKYLLHWWAFAPKKIARKVAEVELFGNYTICRELEIVIAQWPTDRHKLVIHGLNAAWVWVQTTDRAYLTITTVPSLDNCRDCMKVAASYEEEELTDNWDGFVQCNCLIHGLTVHTTYEVISPFPRFRAAVCLNYWNHVVVNTGNFLHVLRVDLRVPKCKNSPADKDAEDAMIGNMVPSDASDVEDIDDTRTECYVKHDGPECVFTQSPLPLDSATLSPHENSHEETSSRASECDSTARETSNQLAKTSPEIARSDSSTLDSCADSIDSEISVNSPPSAATTSSSSTATTSTCAASSLRRNNPEQRAISVRDKILQDFCEDVSQELNIGSDLITLVKHPACSPRSTPQRLPSYDLKQPIWPSPMLTPPSDILSTRNSESSQSCGGVSAARNKRPLSPQPGTSHETTVNNATSVTSINSPLHTLSISPSPSSCCSPRLMSPPIVNQFRHPSPRKRTSLHSPPLPPPPPPPSSLCTATAATTASQPRTRASHKLNLEAEKAYEFTDDALETCEKLSSFRKRRLADKKYEFRDEAEDTENIVPFKHIRDQFEHHRHCSGHRLSSRAVSPALSSARWTLHRFDSEQSETEESYAGQEFGYNEYQYSDTAEKSVLRPINQNQLSNGNVQRDRYGKTHDPAASPLVPRVSLQYPTIKCTAHFKRSYIELDDEMISVITDVEDDETGGYVSYQCVLPMHVHGSGYVQMQMISNSKAEKMLLPSVSIAQLSFDIETFSHHIADWICKRFKKKYWHCSDYDIEIIDVCAISGDVICLLIMKIQASEDCARANCSQERKHYEVGCKYTWNIETNQYRITNVLPLQEIKSQSWISNFTGADNSDGPLWNPTRLIAPQLRWKSQQPYARSVRFLQNRMGLTAHPITRMYDLDNLVSFYMTPLPDED